VSYSPITHRGIFWLRSWMQWSISSGQHLIESINDIVSARAERTACKLGLEKTRQICDNEKLATSYDVRVAVPQRLLRLSILYNGVGRGICSCLASNLRSVQLARGVSLIYKLESLLSYDNLD
jgi:hypothetical protein